MPYAHDSPTRRDDDAAERGPDDRGAVPHHLVERGRLRQQLGRTRFGVIAARVGIDDRHERGVQRGRAVERARAAGRPSTAPRSSSADAPSARTARTAGCGAGRAVDQRADRRSTTRIIGTSCTSPISADRERRVRQPVHLDEQRDQRDLAADLRDQLAAPEQPEVARLPQRRDVDGEPRRARAERRPARAARNSTDTAAAVAIPDLATRLYERPRT